MGGPLYGAQNAIDAGEDGDEQELHISSESLSNKTSSADELNEGADSILDDFSADSEFSCEDPFAVMEYDSDWSEVDALLNVDLDDLEDELKM